VAFPDKNFEQCWTQSAQINTEPGAWHSMHTGFVGAWIKLVAPPLAFPQKEQMASARLRPCLESQKATGRPFLLMRYHYMKFLYELDMKKILITFEDNFKSPIT
jgi:hypothetical protein